jgi:hypothetical protein
MPCANTIGHCCGTPPVDRRRGVELVVSVFGHRALCPFGGAGPPQWPRWYVHRSYFQCFSPIGDTTNEIIWDDTDIFGTTHQTNTNTGTQCSGGGGTPTCSPNNSQQCASGGSGTTSLSQTCSYPFPEPGVTTISSRTNSGQFSVGDIWARIEARFDAITFDSLPWNNVGEDFPARRSLCLSDHCFSGPFNTRCAAIFKVSKVQIELAGGQYCVLSQVQDCNEIGNCTFGPPAVCQRATFAPGVVNLEVPACGVLNNIRRLPFACCP